MGVTMLAELGLPLAAFLIGLFTFISAQLDLRRKANRQELHDLEEELKAAAGERDRLRTEVAELRFGNYRLYQKIDSLERRLEERK